MGIGNKTLPVCVGTMKTNLELPFCFHPKALHTYTCISFCNLAAPDIGWWSHNTHARAHVGSFLEGFRMQKERGYTVRLRVDVEGYGRDKDVEWVRQWLEEQLSALLAGPVSVKVRKVVWHGDVVGLRSGGVNASSSFGAGNGRDVGQVAERLREVGRSVHGDEDDYRTGPLQ